ncbi:hypothetical protein [Streptomyces sp. NPDC057253]|uniref:hypothetical protein n=1 Tax=Streptomyces sp. NPDC057253 TaxID=3346069 RepID=UPI00362BF7ED
MTDAVVFLGGAVTTVSRRWLRRRRLTGPHRRRYLAQRPHSRLHLLDPLATVAAALTTLRTWAVRLPFSARTPTTAGGCRD